MMLIAPEREHVEELAEEIFALQEIDDCRYERLTGGSKVPRAEAVLDAMMADGLARREGDRVVLTPSGSEIARTIIRRHRLAEVLFSQVLTLREEVTETTACEVEHILSVEATESVCTFLGHPPYCPHGKPIPRGRCCEILRREVSPLVMRLMDLPPGGSARIVFMTPQARTSLERIATLGVVPGADVRLRQKKPTAVLEVGHTTVAVDPRIAADIYVRRIPEDTGR